MNNTPQGTEATDLLKPDFDFGYSCREANLQRSYVWSSTGGDRREFMSKTEAMLKVGQPHLPLQRSMSQTSRPCTAYTQHLAQRSYL
jgi:hypothetical protein